MNRRCLLMTLTILLTSLPSVTAQDGAILLSPWANLKWRGDYVAARKEAMDKNLPIVLDFGTSDCFWCRKLDETTFRDPRVVALMNERFIPLKIDAEREVTLANHLRIESYPTLVFASHDGKILAYLKGYQDAETFHNALQRITASANPADPLQKDFDLAMQRIQKGEYAVAIPYLKSILQVGNGKAIATQAKKYLDAIELKAQEKINVARDLEEQGKTKEAIEAYHDAGRYYPGLDSTRNAQEQIVRLNAQLATERKLADRGTRAREILAQARDFQKKGELVLSLERCSVLLREFADAPESQEAGILMGEFKNNPATLQAAADSLSERLGDMYLALAESYMTKNQPQRAEFYLQRVVLSCPGSSQAASAQVRLSHIQSLRPREGTLTSVRPPE